MFLAKNNTVSLILITILSIFSLISIFKNFMKLDSIILFLLLSICVTLLASIFLVKNRKFFLGWNTFLIFVITSIQTADVILKNDFSAFSLTLIIMILLVWVEMIISLTISELKR